jgi:hypothetical protein
MEAKCSDKHRLTRFSVYGEHAAIKTLQNSVYLPKFGLFGRKCTTLRKKRKWLKTAKNSQIRRLQFLTIT